MRRVRLVGFRLRLNRLDVLDEVLDPLLVHFIAAVEPLEDRSPDRHVARAVRGGGQPLVALDDTLHARRRPPPPPGRSPAPRRGPAPPAAPPPPRPPAGTAPRPAPARRGPPPPAARPAPAPRAGSRPGPPPNHATLPPSPHRRAALTG